MSNLKLMKTSKKSAEIVGYKFTNGITIYHETLKRGVLASVAFQFLEDGVVNVWVESRSGTMLKTLGKKIITVHDFNDLVENTEYDSMLFTRRAFELFGVDV